VLVDHGLIGPLKEVAQELTERPESEQLEEMCRRMLPP
jgi:hypothetical protein